MAFIYTFFVIGIITTIICAVPAIVEIVTFFQAIFGSYKELKEMKLENRRAKIEAKKRKKNNVENPIIEANATLVNDTEETKEEVIAEEVKTEPVVEVIEETKVVEEVKPEEIARDILG